MLTHMMLSYTILRHFCTSHWRSNLKVHNIDGSDRNLPHERVLRSNVLATAPWPCIIFDEDTMETLDRKRNVSSIVKRERQMFSQVSQQRRRREADPTEGHTSGPARLHSCLLVFVRFSVSGLAIRQQMALRPTSLLRRPPAALLSNHPERATRLGHARVRCNARLPTSGSCTAPPKIGFQCRHTLPIDRNANSSTGGCERIPLLT